MINAQLGLRSGDLEQQKINLQAAQERRINATLDVEIDQKRQLAREARLRGDKVAAENAEFQATELERRRDAQSIISARNAQAEAARAQARTAGAGVAEQKRQFDLTHVPVQFPDKDVPGGFRTGYATADELARLKATGVRVDADKLFQQQHTLFEEQKQADAVEQKRADDAHAAEVAILHEDPKGNKNVNDPAVQAKIDEFHTKSKATYAYDIKQPLWKSPWGEIYSTGGKFPTRVPIVAPDGTPIPVSDAYKVWREFQRKNKSNIEFIPFINTYINQGRQ